MKIKMKEGIYQGAQYVQHLVMIGNYAKASCMAYKKDFGIMVSDLHIYDEDDYRKGFGSALIGSVIGDGSLKVRLEVVKSNKPAIALYHKFGFYVIQERNKILVLER